jgi:hypothetical protein
MNPSFLRIVRPVAAVALLAFASCSRQAVTLVPGEDDLVTLNGCVISACNYLAVVKTQHSLEKNFWAKIMLVKFDNHPAGHAYCVWETEGNIYGYDRNSGSFPLPVYTRDARAIAIVLAQELGKVLKEPLAVSQADFIDASESQVYTFASLELRNRTAPTMATAFQMAPLGQP